MQTSYFTFGQSHTHRMSNCTLDRDTVVKITAPDPREVMFNLFGTKWCGEYSPDEIELQYYTHIYDYNLNKLTPINHQ